MKNHLESNVETWLKREHMVGIILKYGRYMVHYNSLQYSLINIFMCLIFVQHWFLQTIIKNFPIYIKFNNLHMYVYD